jgi:hypothetical protein
MSVTRIRIEDVGRATQIDDLDAALLTLMKIAGIDDGGIAGIVFSDFGPEAWEQADQWTRVQKIAEWIRTERNYERMES